MKKDDFCDLLSKTMDAWFELAEYYGINKSYQNFVDSFSLWSRLFEPFRDNLNRRYTKSFPYHMMYHYCWAQELEGYCHVQGRPTD
jgi:hypothetical protein